MNRNRHEIRWRIYRATFDTNIFFRTLIWQGNLANRLISLWRDGRFVLVLSQAIVEELQGLTSRPHLIRKHQYTPRKAADLIDLLTQQASIVEVPYSFKLCRDVKDDKIVDCAALERVHYLVSYDKDLVDDSKLRRALFEFGVEIVEPPDFLEKILEAEIVIHVSKSE